MKIKNLLKKLPVITAGAGAFITAGTQFAYADANGALNQAKDNVINQIKPIVNTVVVPVIDVVLVAILCVLIAKAVASYKRGVEIELLGIVLMVAGITLVTTFPVWGWALIG